MTFGPRAEKVLKKKIPKKMKTAALLSVLSAKLRDKEIIILDDLSFKEPKTKLMIGILEKLKKDLIKKESVLIVLPNINKNIKVAAGTLPRRYRRCCRGQ